MIREQKEVKVRMILQDYHRRNDYELQQAVNDILALDPLPPEGAGEVLEKHLADLRKADIKPPLRYGVIYNRIIDAMHEFAAQQQPTAEGVENGIPTREENPNGLYQRYIITKTDGDAVDKNAEYFVLRVDKGGNDPKHIAACRKAVIVYANAIKDHLPKLSKDLIERYSDEQPTAEGAEDTTENPCNKCTYNGHTTICEQCNDGNDYEHFTYNDPYSKESMNFFKVFIKARKELCSQSPTETYSLEEAIRKAFDGFFPKPLSIVDDAEKILNSHPYLKVWIENPGDSEMKVCNIEQAVWAIQEHTSLHAQKIADKMVSERMREAFEAGKKHQMKPYTTDLADEDCPDFDEWITKKD